MESWEIRIKHSRDFFRANPLRFSEKYTITEKHVQDLAKIAEVTGINGLRDLHRQEQSSHSLYEIPEVYRSVLPYFEICQGETAVLLSQLKQKPDDYINVTIELDDMDITSAETKATYDEIKKYVAEHNAGMKVSNLYISQVKRKCGIEVGKNLCVATRRMDCLQGNSTTAATDLELVPSPNLPKNEDSRQPQCPEDKERAIVWRH